MIHLSTHRGEKRTIQERECRSLTGWAHIQTKESDSGPPTYGFQFLLINDFQCILNFCVFVHTLTRILLTGEKRILWTQLPSVQYQFAPWFRIHPRLFDSHLLNERDPFLSILLAFGIEEKLLVGGWESNFELIVTLMLHALIGNANRVSNTLEIENTLSPHNHQGNRSLWARCCSPSHSSTWSCYECRRSACSWHWIAKEKTGLLLCREYCPRRSTSTEDTYVVLRVIHFCIDGIDLIASSTGWAVLQMDFAMTVYSFQRATERMYWDTGGTETDHLCLMQEHT